MTKGEKLEQRYINASWGEVEVGHGQRGSKEKHTSRGRKLMNLFVCI
jgi:hypothetical protein